MNRRQRQNKQQPYQPYKNAWDAALDIRQEPPQDKRVTQLVVAHNSVVSKLDEFQQRYELLSTEERERVDFYLQNVYEILGIQPGQSMSEGEDFFNIIQLLMTDVKDHTVRIGRLEQLLERIFAQLPKQDIYAHPPSQDSYTPKNISTQRMITQAPEANAQIIQSVSQSNNSVSQSHESLVMWVKQIKMANPKMGNRGIVEVIKEQTGISVGKDKVNEIVKRLQSSGQLAGDDLEEGWNA